jgi:hypothetical protein
MPSDCNYGNYIPNSINRLLFVLEMQCVFCKEKLYLYIRIHAADSVKNHGTTRRLEITRSHEVLRSKRRHLKHQ